MEQSARQPRKAQRNARVETKTTAGRGRGSRVQGSWNASQANSAQKKPARPTQPDEDEASATYVPAASVPRIRQDNVVVLSTDGVVLLRKAFSLADQQRWIDMCIQYGNGEVEGVHSFYEGEVSQELGYFDPSVSSAPTELTSGSEEKKSKQLNLVNKARINVPISKHPEEFTIMAQELVCIAHEHCSAIPRLDHPNTCRINYYTNKGKIGWHYDRVPGLTREQQRTVTDPVISMSFGNSAEFKFRHHMDDPEESIILESGDVIIFGGLARMIYHTVPHIIKNSTPKGLDLRQFSPGRFNVSYYYN